MEPDKAAGLSGRRIVATSEINGFKGSLTRRTLIKFAIRIAIVVAAMTAIAYFHVISLVTEQSLGQLEEYVVERGDRERSVFQLAQDNQAILKKEILRRIADLGTDDPKEEFDRLFVEFPDGVTRSRLEGYDGTRTSGLYIGKDVVIDAAVRRRVLA